MRSVSDAQAAVIATLRRLPAQRVALAAAHNRIIASPVTAARPLPGFTNSAMDGFAVRSTDLPGRLPVTHAIAAGDLDPAPLPAYSAARIMTGAILPAGADTVVMFEDSRPTDNSYVELPASPPGANIRRTGEDVAAGARVLAPGTRLTSGGIAVLAALGQADVEISRAPRVAIVATGNELVDVATPPRPGQLVDSSAHMLAAQIRDAGGAPSYLGVGRDDRDELRRLIETAVGHDAMVTTGGVSAGDHDHVLAALGDAGVEVGFWKVAMKPGKPFAFGIAAATSTPVFALPGNPVSSWIAFELFVRPALLAMQGATHVHRPRAPVVLPAGYTKPAGRAHYLRASLHRDGERLVATLHGKQGSAMLSSLIGVDAIVEVPADATEIAAGATCDALLLEVA
jgi:molybdopterin molybdotransferase